MEIRTILRKGFAILAICSCGIAFIGYMQNRKACKQYKKMSQKADTKEKMVIVIQEFPKIFMAGRNLFLTGVLLGSIFGIIAIFILRG